MGIGSPSLSGRPASAVTAVSHAVTQACTRVAAALRGIRESALPMVTLVTTSHEESWYMPAPRQAHDALLMLLMTPPEGLRY